MKSTDPMIFKNYLKDVVFKVKETSYTVNGELFIRQFIVLCDKKTDLIIYFTNYADYVLYLRDIDMSYSAKNENGMFAVVQFLNYAFLDNFEKYHIFAIEDVKEQMIKDFLEDYSNSLTKSNRYPKKETVIMKRNQISDFFYNACHYLKGEMKYLKKGDLKKKIPGTKINDSKVVYEYPIKIRYKEDTEPTSLYRDMPLEMVERFIKMAELYDPELVLAIVLMAYVGLREGEVCNLTRERSIYGPRVIFTLQAVTEYIDGKPTTTQVCVSIEINLKKELILRSDGVSVGKIKRKREQPVFSGFNQLVFDYYQRHLKLTESKEIEEYGPLFIEKNKKSESGKYMALTKEAMVKRLKNLFWEKVYPSLLKDYNPKFQEFYQHLKRHSWGPHSFRHWYTVYLVLTI